MADQTPPEGVVMQAPETIHKGDVTTVPSGTSYKVKPDGTITDVDPGDVQALVDHGYRQVKTAPPAAETPAQAVPAERKA